MIFNFIFSVMTHIAYANKRWQKCQRWYKWPSVIPLFLANTLAPISILLYGTGLAIFSSGECCASMGNSQSNTVYVTTYTDGSRTAEKGNGCICYIFAGVIYTYSWLSMAGGLICYLSVWLFLALSGIYCYEEVNYSKKTQLFRLKKMETESTTEATAADVGDAVAAAGNSSKSKPKLVYVYEDMNIFSKVVRTVSYDEIIYGKNVYTGWIMISEGWIKIHDMKGNKLFDVEDVVDAPVVNIPPEVYYEPATKANTGAAGTTKVYPQLEPKNPPDDVENSNTGGSNVTTEPWVTARNDNPYTFVSSKRQGQV